MAGSHRSHAMSQHEEEVDVDDAFVRLGDALKPGAAWRRKANIARIMGDDPPPMRVGRFTVVDFVGRGAMGQVFAAYDDALDRKVAIKLLTGPTSPAALDRFAREARALAKLSHPNIVQIHEVGEHEGAMFIAMEFVTGRTLAQWLAPGTASWREIVGVFVEAGRGLAAAHAAELVHRDFKPDNVIVGDDDRVRVLDFGLARAAERADAITPSADSGERSVVNPGVSGSDRLTQTGSLVGTPAYMAPEQLAAKDVTAASDQFSFCVALYEALFGVRPFAGRDPFAIAAAIEARQFQAPKRSAPRWLAAVVHRGLAVRPEDRWPSVDALLAELVRKSSPSRRWLVGVLGIGLATFGGGLWYQADLGRRCTGGDARIAEVWNDAQRQRVRDALLATGTRFSDATWSSVESTLDAYAEGWSRAHAQTCEATEVRREQSAAAMDVKMRCLDRQRVELRTALDVLADADASVVEQAIPLVAGLPAPSICDDVGERDPLMPDDPELARRVEAERERLSRIKTLQRAGQYAAAESEATHALGDAEAIDHGPLVAELLEARGTARLELVRVDEARQDIRAAYLLATEHEHARVEGSTARSLANLMSRHMSQYDAAMQWAETAIALSRRPGGTTMERALALDASAGVLSRLNRMVEAIAHQEQAIALVEETEGPDSLRLAHLLSALGEMRRMTNELEAGKALHERALVIRESVLGPEHPLVAASVLALASVRSAMGELDEALAMQHRALSIMENVGYPHPTLAATQAGIGLALTRKRRDKEAVDWLERALETHERTLGSEHPDAARVWTALADARKSQGDLQGALEAHQRGLAIRRKAFGAEAYVTATSALSVGQFMVELGRFAEGRAMILEALGVLEGEAAAQTQGKPRLMLAMAYGSLSRAARGLGDVDAAIDYGHRSVEHADYPDTSIGVLVWAQEQVHESLWLDPTQRRLARELAKQAMSDTIAAGVKDARYVEGFRAWLEDHPLPE